MSVFQSPTLDYMRRYTIFRYLQTFSAKFSTKIAYSLGKDGKGALKAEPSRAKSVLAVHRDDASDGLNQRINLLVGFLRARTKVVDKTLA